MPAIPFGLNSKKCHNVKNEKPPAAAGIILCTFWNIFRLQEEKSFNINDDGTQW